MTLEAQREKPAAGDAPPRLSVIVPCYNGAMVLSQFVPRTTAAVRALGGGEYEILMVDDG